MKQDLTLDKIHQFYLKSELLDKNNHFIRDGIINEDLFAAQSKRVLFVTKEHNLIQKGEYAEKPNDGYSEWWNRHVHLQFSHRISEWAYGILNDFPAFSPGLDKDIKHDSLRSIAFINVKKSGGSSTAKPEVIWDYIDQTRDLLVEQIGDINPTHIVTCFRYDVSTQRNCLALNYDLLARKHLDLGYGETHKSSTSTTLQLEKANNFFTSNWLMAFDNSIHTLRLAASL